MAYIKVTPHDSTTTGSFTLTVSSKYKVSLTKYVSSDEIDACGTLYLSAKGNDGVGNGSKELLKKSAALSDFWYLYKE